jgi:hypothetical protein
MITPRDAFTCDELLEIARSTGLEVEKVSEEDDEQSLELVFIRFENDDIEWDVHLGHESPFYESMRLLATIYVKADPFPFCNSWNLRHSSGVALVVPELDTGVVLKDEDGDCFVHLCWSVPFHGSVTPEYLKFVFGHWVDLVYEFYGFEVEMQESPELISVQSSMSNYSDGELKKELLISIETMLIIQPDMTCREIAQKVDVTKYEINHLLYKYGDRFLKTATQPPTWRVKD